MEKIDYEIDDFIDYCTSKNLSTKTIGSYEQTLRLFIRYLRDKDEKKENDKNDKIKVTKKGKIKTTNIGYFFDEIKIV